MASSSSPTSQPPTLKDFLFQEGKATTHFVRSMERPQATVRNLLEMELRAGQEEAVPALTKSRSRAASVTITKLQAASQALVRAVKLLHLASPTSKTRHVLWRSKSRKQSEDPDTHSRMVVRIKDIMRWKSLNEAHLVVDCKTSTNNESSRSSVSSSHSWTEAEPPPDIAPLPESWSPEFSSSQKSKNSVGDGGESASTSYGEQEVKGGRKLATQLSPISVLEFPDEDSNSPSSSSGFPNAGGSHRPELAPVHLEQKLDLSDDPDDLRRKRAQFDDVEEKAKELLELVKSALSGECLSYVQTAEKLLLDFLREAVSAAAGEDEETVKLAVEWAEGEGWWEAESLAAVVREMEEDGRRQAAEEAEAVAAEVEGGVFESLVEELVAGLRRWSPPVHVQ